MTEDKIDHQEQIQTTVSATFAAPLVPTDVELGDAAIEALSPPLVEQGDSVPAAEDKVDDWVRQVRKSTARTLELSKRLDDVLARPMRWFHRSADIKETDSH
jgi:hypothetical protein